MSEVSARSGHEGKCGKSTPEGINSWVNKLVSVTAIQSVSSVVSWLAV